LQARNGQMYSIAQQAEIVRSNQKDEFYVSFMRGSMASIMQSLVGKLLAHVARLSLFSVILS